MTVQLISPRHLEELRTHTAADTTLQTLYNVIQRGWPSRACSVPDEATLEWKRQSVEHVKLPSGHLSEKTLKMLIEHAAHATARNLINKKSR
ncbi:hypothetical protein SKAU_G00283800 [Synaphobranchus kaupii]|uniref:Uncharacterized protein n=1 Tax=Synaphobranchus kaupii TaxID=118154 RepID=A0A9Q1EXU8_SYNKA|nr:hypothetical protein SKAU_G00283800 [Synaphobranchus kaupii]